MPIRVQKLHPWIEFKNVISALLKREMATRLGNHHLGALWLILEPLTSVIVLGLLLGPFIGRSSGSIPYPFFILCGFMQLKNFTNPLSSGASALSSNEGLLVFRQVEPIDPFIARFIFSFLSIVITFIIFCIVGHWIGIEVSRSHIWTLAYCFIITALTGWGLGLFLGIKTTQNKDLEKLMLFIQRPLLFVSCILYPYDVLPAEAQEILYWNPLCHTVEISRYCLFPKTYDHGDLNLIYPTVFAVVSVAVGLAYYRNNRHYLKQR